MTSITRGEWAKEPNTGNDSLSSEYDFCSHFTGQNKSHGRNQVRKKKEGQDKLTSLQGESGVEIIYLHLSITVCVESKS